MRFREGTCPGHEQVTGSASSDEGAAWALTSARGGCLGSRNKCRTGDNNLTKVNSTDVPWVLPVLFNSTGVCYDCGDQTGVTAMCDTI